MLKVCLIIKQLLLILVLRGNSIATVVDSDQKAYNDEYNSNQYSSTTYTGSQGNSATVYTGPEGNYAVQPNNNVSSGSATTYWFSRRFCYCLHWSSR